MKLHLNKVMMTDVCTGNQHTEYAQEKNWNYAFNWILIHMKYSIVYVCDLNLNILCTAHLHINKRAHDRRLIRHSTCNFNGINHTADRP